MEGENCPNMSVCRLITVKGFTGDELNRLNYMKSYCTAGEGKWTKCTRLIVKKALNFCPDFVLPDTPMTPDEVIDQFDREQMNDE